MMGMQKHVLSLLIVLLLGCAQDSVLESKTGNIAFYLSEDANVSGRRMFDYRPAFVLLSIEKANGEVVEKNKKIPLYSFSTGYVSEDLLLATADYKLTQFVVLNSDDEVIYATPREGSP